jgi:hypothetical protein
LIDRGEGDVDELRSAINLSRNELGDFDIEADELIRAAGISFDKGRSAFRIARPTKFAGCCAGTSLGNE